MPGSGRPPTCCYDHVKEWEREQVAEYVASLPHDHPHRQMQRSERP